MTGSVDAPSLAIGGFPKSAPSWSGSPPCRPREKVLVFLRHTGSTLPQRLLRLIRTITPRVEFIDARKVPAGRRGAWIDSHVLATGCEFLVYPTPSAPVSTI